MVFLCLVGIKWPRTLSIMRVGSRTLSMMAVGPRMLSMMAVGPRTLSMIIIIFSVIIKVP